MPGNTTSSKRKVGLFVGENLQRLFAAHGEKDFEALVAQRAAQRPQGQRLVIHDQDGIWHA